MDRITSVATPYRPVMSPVRPSVATPVQPIATYPSVATSLPINATPPQVAMPTPDDAMTERVLFHSPAMAPPQTTPLMASNAQFSNFSDQLLLEFSSFAPELENMLQTDTRATFQEQWSTPQWNFGGLVSNPFAVTDPTAVNTTKHDAVFSTGNTDTASINYFSVAAHHEPYNAAVGLSPLSFGSSPQSSNELPLLPPFPSDDDGMWTIILDTVVGWATNVFHCQSDSGEPESPVAGCGKCLPVPSLCAQRDNMIGDRGKENSLPVFTEKRVTRTKVKRRAADDANGPLPKKPK